MDQSTLGTTYPLLLLRELDDLLGEQGSSRDALRAQISSGLIYTAGAATGLALYHKVE